MISSLTSRRQLYVFDVNSLATELGWELETAELLRVHLWVYDRGWAHTQREKAKTFRLRISEKDGPEIYTLNNQGIFLIAQMKVKAYLQGLLP